MNVRVKQLGITGLLVAALFLCSSCNVYSLYPWFGKGDIVFDQRLLGKWIEMHEQRRAADFVVTRGQPNSYRVTYKDSDSSTYLNAKLAKIGDAYFLDYSTTGPKDSDDPWLSCMHWIARLEFGNDKVRYWMLAHKSDEEWNSAVEKVQSEDPEFRWVVSKNDSKGAPSDFLILSPKPVLRRFLLAHGKDPHFWSDPHELMRPK